MHTHTHFLGRFSLREARLLAMSAGTPERPAEPTPEASPDAAPANPEAVAKEGVEKRQADAKQLAERGGAILPEVMEVPRLNSVVKRGPDAVNVSGGPRAYNFTQRADINDEGYKRLYDCQMHAEGKGIPALTKGLQDLAKSNISDAEFKAKATELMVSTRNEWKNSYGNVLAASGIVLSDGFMRVPNTKAEALANPPKYSLFCDFQKDGKSLTQLNGNGRPEQMMGKEFAELIRVLIQLIKMITEELKKGKTENGPEKQKEDPIGKEIEQDRARLQKERKTDKITDKDLKDYYAESKEKNTKTIDKIDGDLKSEATAKEQVDGEVNKQEDAVKQMKKDSPNSPELEQMESKLTELKGKQKQVNENIKRLTDQKKELTDKNAKIDKKIAYLNRPKSTKEGEEVANKQIKDVAPDARVTRNGNELKVEAPEGLDKIIRDSLKDIDTGDVKVTIIVIKRGASAEKKDEKTA